MSTIKGEVATQGYTITVTPNGGSDKDKLTFVDGNGKTKYYISEGKFTEPVDIPTGTAAEDTGSITIAIAYTGSTYTTAEEHAAAWAAIAKHSSLTFDLEIAGTGAVVAETGHAYEGSAVKVSYTVDISAPTFGNDGSATISPKSFVYSVLGQDSNQENVNVTLSITNLAIPS